MAASNQQLSTPLKLGAIFAIVLFAGAGGLFVGSASWGAERVSPALHTFPMTRQQSPRSSVQVAKTGWALQGRVVDARLQPVAKLTVFLVDGRSRFLAQYGSTHTDNTGFFLLNYAGDQAPTVTQFFLEVANTDGTPAYLSTTPFQPQYGTVSFQNITLPTR